MDAMVKDHEEDVTKFEHALREGQDEDLKQFVKETLPNAAVRISPKRRRSTRTRTPRRPAQGGAERRGGPRQGSVEVRNDAITARAGNTPARAGRTARRSVVVGMLARNSSAT
jgi:hypothetical protein